MTWPELVAAALPETTPEPTCRVCGTAWPCVAQVGQPPAWCLPCWFVLWQRSAEIVGPPTESPVSEVRRRSVSTVGPRAVEIRGSSLWNT